jgi:transcription antitermination protein NusB
MNDSKSGFSRGEKRAAARLNAVQALYQMDLTGKAIHDILAEFESFWMGKEIEGETYFPAEGKLFKQIVEGVLKEQRVLDPKVDEILSDGWPLKRIENVMRATLRAGTYELMFKPDVPVKVVISEYVNIAHAFFEKEEVNMVNAVLDKIGHEVRKGEFVSVK